MNLADHYLPLIIAVPLMAAFLQPLLHTLLQRMKVGPEGARWVKGGLTCLALLLTLLMVLSVTYEVYDTDQIQTYQFGADEPTQYSGADGTVNLTDSKQGGFPLRIFFVVDHFSAFGASLGAFLAFLASVYALSYIRDEERRGWFSNLLLLMTVGLLGMQLTGDLFNLFVFLEITGIASCGLVAFPRRRIEAVEAAFKYLAVSVVGGLLFLLGVGLLYGQYGTLNMAFMAVKLGEQAALTNLDKIVLGLFVGTFAMKASAVPMHMWTPDAYAEAPAPVTLVLLTSTMASLYALSRLVFLLYGQIDEMAHVAGYVFIALGLLSMFVGVTMALIQHDLKRLMAYHSISQVGYMLLGLGVGLAVLGTDEFDDYGLAAMSGGLFHLLNYLLYKGLLFLTAGAVFYKLRTRELSELGGLAHGMPYTTLFFLIGAAAISGIPPFSGFASKLLIYESVYQFNPLLTAVAMVVSIMTLASFVKVFYSAFLGQPHPEVTREVPMTMLTPMAVLALLTLAVGLAPDFVVTYLVEPAAQALANGAGYVAGVLGGGA